MIGLEKHITHLFYSHDCVILPGLGGFLLQASEGRYHVSSQQFTPPCRTVTFNGVLTGDDGLVISSLAQQEGISYAEGKRRVEAYVADLLKRAASVEGATLAQIGKLRMGPEGRLLFTPAPGANFLESSFGLAPLPATASSPKKNIAQPVRRHTRRVDRLPAKQPVQTPAAVRWTVIAAVPVVLFLLWGILFPVHFQRQYTNYSGIVTGWLDGSTSLKPGPHDIPENNPVTVTETLTSGIPDDTAPDEHTQPSGQTAIPVRINEPTIPQEDPVQAPTKDYHVIGGVFSNLANAERYISTLSALGYDARMVGTNRKGHYRVSYQGFATWAEAAGFLEIIKAHHNPSAWILKY